MAQFYTYLHCKPNGDPFYVGKGHDSSSRNRSHDFYSGRSNYHRHIVAKYGKENIKIFVFQCESEEQAFKDEIQQIAQLRKEGYELCNLTDGGEGVSGYKHTKETLLKVSNKLKGRETWNKGIPHSEEAKNKFRLAKIGTKASLEAKKKMSIARTGKHHSEETKEKIRLSKLGKKRSPETIDKIRIANTGKKHSEETKIKCSIASKNRIITDETRLKLSKARTGFKFSEETKLKMSKTRTGKPQSEETKKKRSEAMKIYWANKK